MTDQSKLNEILALPAEEQLEISAAIWESLAATPERVPVPGWHIEILRQRLEEDDADPTGGESWSSVRRRIEGHK